MQFGFLRYILSILVVLSHITKGPEGVYAVFTFYVLSGFLMTFILNEVYHFRFIPYITNRFLRIYSTYYFYLLIAVLLFFLFPMLGRKLDPAMYMPQTTAAVVRNLSIVGFNSYFYPGLFQYDYSWVYKPRLLPASWAMGIEIMFYLLLPFLAKNFQYVKLWFLGSAGILVYGIIAALDFDFRYRGLFFASLPFSAGAYIYYTRDKFHIPFKTFIMVVIVYMSNIFINKVYVDQYYSYLHGFYFNLFLSVFIIKFLSQKNETALYPNYKVKHLDKFFGDLSYPIYLSQWLFAGVVVNILKADYSIHNSTKWSVFVITLIVMHIFVIPVNLLLEPQIYKLRDKIRGRRLDYENC